MTAAMRFSSSNMGQSMAVKHSLCGVPLNRSHELRQAEIKMASRLPSTKMGIKIKPLKLFMAVPNDSITNESSLSPAETIMQFYSAINEKKLETVDKLITEDCFFEDLSFPKPFQGKKEVLHFLEQLTISMGQNMQFNVEHICEGKDNTAGVNWHLGQLQSADWNKLQVPFTKGCSNYSLSVDGDKLVIRKAQVLIESPIKLGIVALTIFKIVSVLFDAFPMATEWFLKSPGIVFQLLLKAYSIAVEPIIGPFLACSYKKRIYTKVLDIHDSTITND
ncbi:UNVERIFIED_CONTAM: hypothetical protein Sangu_1854100 [Sesamum angustifolium]|uniref:SnoaL-like domain-containing protein n=1 Tax=Sesamum angustifolium TaxID=2727405 RepID=A0AAW2MCC4_9LAMI